MRRGVASSNHVVRGLGLCLQRSVAVWPKSRPLDNDRDPLVNRVCVFIIIILLPTPPPFTFEKRGKAGHNHNTPTSGLRLPPKLESWNN